MKTLWNSLVQPHLDYKVNCKKRIDPEELYSKDRWHERNGLLGKTDNPKCIVMIMHNIH